MVERGRGHMVFIASLSGKISSGGSAIYSATKFGLRGFAAGLREDLLGSGVGVTTVYPGFISDAGMFAEAGTKLPPGVGTRTPEAVAEAVVRGIEEGKAELDVAPLGMRLGRALLGPLADRGGRASAAPRIAQGRRLAGGRPALEALAGRPAAIEESRRTPARSPRRASRLRAGPPRPPRRPLWARAIVSPRSWSLMRAWASRGSRARAAASSSARGTTSGAS